MLRGCIRPPSSRFRRPLLILAILIGFHLGHAHESQAQVGASDTLVIPRLVGAIELDGRIEEPAWSGARALTLVQHKPRFGAAPTEETEVLVGYTDEHIYLACRCHDRDPPTAPSFKRDFYSNDSDYFSLVLDTFNDNENAVAFETTPTGLRADQAIAHDAEGDSPNDNDWNTVWEVEVAENDEGWFVEMRIPITSLRFQTERGRVVMGLIVTRYIARNNEIMVFPAIPPHWGGWSPWKPSQAQDVAFDDLEPRTPLRVTPYVLAGLSQQSVLNGAGTAYRGERDLPRDAGVDLKYGVTSNLTLDLTVNTDFAQVEADDQQVNLTRFPLFFPEKRRFFLERASNFALDFGERNRLFYSRRIGLHDGRRVPILGGARLVGRAGPLDIGVLAMRTAREPDLGPGGEAIPSETFGVARLRRRVLNPYSYVGGIFTSRVSAGGAYNVGYGVDGIFRAADDDYVSLKWAQTFENGASNRIVSLDPTRLLLQWERRRYAGIGFDLGYARAGARYRPGLGFELRDDYFRVGDRIGYGWLPEQSSPIQQHRLDMEGRAFFRNSDRSLESLTVGPRWRVETRRGHRLALSARHRAEDLREPFALSNEIVVPAGRHAFQEVELRYGMPSGTTLRADAGVTAGGFFDGRRRSVQLQPTWNASRHLRMTGTYQLDDIRLPSRGTETGSDFTSHIARLRVEITPTVKYAVSAFAQYNSLGDLIFGNLRFRYNPREGVDLYLVYNEEINTDRFLSMPALPRSGGRTLLLKYSYTLDW